MMKNVFLFVAVIIFISCNHQEKAGKDVVATDTATTRKPETRIALAMLDNKKDPVCGMPMSAGITDTLRHNGKLIGFCSPECRDEFIKDPKAYVLDLIGK